MDASVLAFIIWKMAENNDKDYNIYNYEPKVYQISKIDRYYISQLAGSKIHLYSVYPNLMCSERITMTKAKKIKMKIKNDV